MKENEMIHTGRVLIVEGKYDAARLSHLTDAMICLLYTTGQHQWTACILHPDALQPVCRVQHRCHTHSSTQQDEMCIRDSCGPGRCSGRGRCS